MNYELTKYPRLAITAICEHHKDGGAYFRVQSHHRTHQERTYPFRHSACDPFFQAVKEYAEALNLDITGDVYRIHSDWEPDRKTFMFTGRA